MKHKKVKSATCWAVVPFATTREWGHMIVFRDRNLAQHFADSDPFYREVVQYDLIPVKNRGKS